MCVAAAGACSTAQTQLSTGVAALQSKALTVGLAALARQFGLGYILCAFIGDSCVEILLVQIDREGV